MASLAVAAWMVMVLVLVVVPSAWAADKTRFAAPNTLIREFDPGTTSVQREYLADLYYSDLWAPSGAGGGREAMRINTLLHGAGTNVSHHDLRIYEDQFLRFTWCDPLGQCGWSDLFPDSLPRMWCPESGVGGVTPAPSGPQNGIPASQLIEFQTPTNRGTVLTWCLLGTNDPVAVWEPRDGADVLYLMPGVGGNGVDSTPGAFNDTAAFGVPGFCPVVDPSCFRLDLMLVLDHSGSIEESWTKIADFAADLIQQFAVSEQSFKIGVLRYYGGTSCTVPNVGNYTSMLLGGLTIDKESLIAALRDPAFRQMSPPCGGSCPTGNCHTATVKGITAALNELAGPNGRPATRKAAIVVTDGNGNRPGTALTDTQTSLSYAPDVWMTGINDCTCGGCGSSCQETRHDQWLCVAYRQKWNVTQPTMYAVGVPEDPVTTATCGGGGPSCGTLNRIALNDGGDCPGWWPDAGGTLDTTAVHDRAVLVATFDSLGEVTYQLAETLLCPNPGATPCPNDCRPGGFCCGGACVCVEDCTVTHPGDACQTGVCATTALGTQCVAVGPDCSNTADNTGVIVGGVIGGALAICCLCFLAALIAAVVALLVRKSMHDVQAWEDAFAKGNAISDSPLYETKDTSITSALYETQFDGDVVG